MRIGIDPGINTIAAVWINGKKTPIAGEIFIADKSLTMLERTIKNTETCIDYIRTSLEKKDSINIELTIARWRGNVTSMVMMAVCCGMLYKGLIDYVEGITFVSPSTWQKTNKKKEKNQEILLDSLTKNQRNAIIGLKERYKDIRINGKEITHNLIDALGIALWKK